MKKQISKAIKIVKQDNGAVVFDKDTGMYLQTNDVGVCILEKLSESYTVEKIVKHISDIFKIDIKQAESDVNDFLKALREVGLY